jgi:3-phytase
VAHWFWSSPGTASADPSTAARNESPVSTNVAARGQTTPSEQDAASDVAVWLHPSDPGRSLVLGAGGSAGLEVYALDGKRLQRIGDIQADFVDVRYGMALGERSVDLAVVGELRSALLHFYEVDAGTRELRRVAG